MAELNESSIMLPDETVEPVTDPNHIISVLAGILCFFVGDKPITINLDNVPPGDLNIVQTDNTSFTLMRISNNEGRSN